MRMQGGILHKDSLCRKNYSNDAVLKTANFVFAICVAMLILCVAIFGGAALGNQDIVNSLLENDLADSLTVAEAGVVSGGTSINAFSISALGTTDVNQNFSESNVYYTRYYSNKDHGNRLYMGDGYFGNGGTDLKKYVTISSASINFKFTGVASNLQKKGLLTIEITATVEAKNRYDGTRMVGYRLGGGLMHVEEDDDSLLTGFTDIASGKTDSNGEYYSGTKSVELSSVQTNVCIGVGGRCKYTDLVGGRFPGQIARNISIKCISRDTDKPVFTYPTITSWEADVRSVTYKATDVAEISDSKTYESDVEISPVYTKKTDVWNMTFTADYRYNYYLTAEDTSGNSATSSTWNYIDFRLDAFAPKVLKVL